MKFKPFTLLIFLIVCSSAFGQISKKPSKYPSLFWEITKKGSTKPSYLFGTMHVSSKLVYNLPDSFYMGIKNVQVVALENDMAYWQQDMDKYDMDPMSFMRNRNRGGDHLSINTFKVQKYEELIKYALASNPSVINNLLYRTYGGKTSDFEEDTFLDMFIYQCGRKYGKKTAGLENFDESMQLMIEAVKDAAKDKNKKQRSYDNYNSEYSFDKLEEAYRTGNLDLLDSINRYNSQSELFDEKFLYRRNEIQANSIDSIIKTGASVFAGVGAAHLPGTRGVIELLRSKGYIVRPVKMAGRSNQEKDAVDKITVPVTMQKFTAEDGTYQLQAPGALFSTNHPFFNQVQHADVSNGSYYMVTKITTNALMWGQKDTRVLEVIDSLLYESIPGKILSKETISRSGYQGYDIVNRTRRGDVQRYNIFVTPYEVLIFKMSGIGNYVSNSTEGKEFFSSIQLKNYKEQKNTGKLFTPASGGFAVAFPHEPYFTIKENRVYDAVDDVNHYRVVATSLHNYTKSDEDTFELSLAEESFKASAFIDKQLERKQIKHKGYPALHTRFRDKDGKIFMARFILQGAHYYAVIVHAAKENPAMEQFINSFELQPFVYGSDAVQKDTTLYYTVNTPFYPVPKRKTDLKELAGMYDKLSNEDEVKEEFIYKTINETKVIQNDTTGERIEVNFYKMPFYTYVKDSASLTGNEYEDTSRIVRWQQKTVLPNKMNVWETYLSDKGSSRMVHVKSFLKDGMVFTIQTLRDTLTKPSPFISRFFETFTPDTTLKGFDIMVKKSDYFFSDFQSADTVLHKRAKKYISSIVLDSADFPKLKNAIEQINWKEKNYLDTKSAFIKRLASIKTTASSQYLHDLYFAAGDTIQLQYVVLETLLRQQTAAAYKLFRDIVKAEPPIIEKSDNDYDYRRYTSGIYGLGSELPYGEEDDSDDDFVDNMSDTLLLVKAILPDLLPLVNLEDYKDEMMELLADMVEDSVITAADYQMYFDKFLLEAKHLWRKQIIAEKKKSIQKAEATKNKEEANDDEDIVVTTSFEEEDETNSDLILYSRLLIPSITKSQSVQAFVTQLLQSESKQLKYDVMEILLKNKQQVPDTLLRFFASKDEYRYRLLKDLKEWNMEKLFPAKYRNHKDLAMGKLLWANDNEKPDTISFMKRYAMTIKDKKGYIYFFRYKMKKDDVQWKIATVGLVPEADTEIEFENDRMWKYYNRYRMNRNDDYEFTQFTKTALETDEPEEAQLQKLLKRILITSRTSGADFYRNEKKSLVDVESMYE